MKTRRLFLAPLVLAFVCVQFAFGWGNATHVYFAKQLGVKFGTPNMNEMYGSLLPDCFNLVWDLQGLYEPTHDNAMNVWQAASGRIQKSLALGFMTHNQTWGADYTAHIKSFTFPSFVNPATGKPGGYAVEKGVELMQELAPVVAGILVGGGVPAEEVEMYAMGVSLELGHDLSETAVDLLVKRNLDPAIGARMVLAAKLRPACAGDLLAAAYASYLASMPPEAAEQTIKAVEQGYREYIIQYGMAFCLPERQTIEMLSQQMAPVAEEYIEANLAPLFPLIDVTVTPDQVGQFIRAAIKVVKHDYAKELSMTLCFVEQGMRENGIRNGWPILAHDATQEAVESIDQLGAPTTFALAQNTPNPFNPSTTINFSMPARGHARLTVFNALGQEVATLVDDETPAGLHAARWDATHQPSGAYFYRIESGSFVETKRMMLLK